MSIEKQAPTAGNENTGWLKCIAILCMIVDHVGVAFFPLYRELRVIGRIAYPLFAWCIVVGCCHTRNIWKYALRILLVGLVAQPCYMLGLRHHWYELNVFATLLLGVLAIAGIRAKWRGSAVWAPILAIAAACAVKMDYGWKGVAFILVLYACRQSRPALGAGMAAYCLYWGSGSMTLSSFLGIPAVKQIAFLPQAGSLLSSLAPVQFWAILALPLMLIPMKRQYLLPKWIGYAAYPAHLLVIALIRLMV